MWGDQWSLANLNGLEAARYSWSDLRYSISWKAYCFKDEAEKATWSDQSDDLTLDRILHVLEAALRSRGVLTTQRPDPTRFAQMLVNESVVTVSAIILRLKFALFVFCGPI